MIPRFDLHPDVLVVMGAVAVGYRWMINRFGPASRRQIVWFSSGLLLATAAAMWPIHDMAEHSSYGIHMAEHLVFTLFAAPMMLLGAPKAALEWALEGRPWEPLFRPLPALIVNSLVLIGSHWPAVVDTTTHNETFHFAVHCVLFGAAAALWMPVVRGTLSRPAQILYLFGQSMAPIPPTLWLIFSQTPLYRAYLPGLAALGWSATGDQEVAGSLMGAFTPVVLWGVMAYLFFAWWGEEQRYEAATRLTPDDKPLSPRV